MKMLQGRALLALALLAFAGGAAGEDSFARPPRAAGVHAWWHWVDGAISREGITKDLEALAKQGVVQATILNVGLFDGREFGVPRVRFATPEWFAMLRFALDEAQRVGIRIGVHNCDGWSSSGGPWIAPEQSMKQLAWTKTLVEGGRALDLALPRPAEVAGLYRDVAVVAYPTRQKASAFRAAAPRLRVNDADADLAPLVDGSPVSSRVVRAGDRLSLEAASALAFERVALHLRRPFMWGDPKQFVTRVTVEVSDDGQAYRPLAELTVRGLNRTEILDVPQARARFARLTVRELSAIDPWFPVELSELELLGDGESPAHAPTIPFVAEKTSAIRGGDEDVYAAAAEDAPAVPLGDVVVLTDRTDASGRLRWQAPAGSWAILRFGYTSTGATNAPATAEGLGLECDKLDKAAVEHHFRSFPQRVIDAAGEHAGRTLGFVLVDSWEAGFQNWTDRLPAEFEKRRGYSLLPWLPALTGETLGSTRESEAVLYDFRQTIADLIRESYYETLAALLHERGVELHAEVIYGGAGYPPLDVLRSTKPVDLPMFEYWTSTDADTRLSYAPVEGPELNLPFCAAAGYGKPLVGSEAYTGYAHYSESPGELAPFGDRAFTAGLNRMILHSSVHQPTEDKPGLTLGQFGSHFNRHNTYWPYAGAWLAYQARVQAALDEGAAQFDVLYYLGDQLPQSFVRNPSTTLPPGYAVTAVNAEILNERVSVADGRLKLNGEGEAALISLPPQPVLGLDSLRRIAALVREGAHVYGPKPQRPLSLADTRAAGAFRELADRVWGDLDGRTVFTRAYGKGRVSWGRPLAEVLAAAAPPQFSASPAGEKEFLFLHRRAGDEDVFFVFNQQDRVLERELSFRVSGRSVEVRDPETGRATRPAATRQDGPLTRFAWRFAPRQALLFVFRPGAPGPEVAIANHATPVPVALSGLRGTLELRAPGESARQPVEISELRSLAESSDPELRYFSGEATYRLRFAAADAVADPGETLLLDVGDFGDIAEVALNGRALGTLWRPGTPLDVTPVLRQGENELVVTVANAWRNRLIGDLARYGELRSVRTSAPVKEQLSATKPLKKSGLIGPVRVLRLPAPGLAEARR